MSAFFATCPKGLEYLLKDELIAIGASDVREALAGVSFSGNIETAYRVCLWSRMASRVLLPLAEFDAADPDQLYMGVQDIEWSEHLGPNGTLAVDANTAISKLTHSQFIALKTKDAIVDQFRGATGARPDIDPEEPDLRVNVRVRRDRATLSIDLSGLPLHRRNWREQAGEAPLKENLAAAMLVRAQWPRIYAEGGSLVDPMCGSGTLLIEAAHMAADVAPGLRRDYFGFLGWAKHDYSLWRSIYDEAKARADEGLRNLRPVFFGSDSDANMVQTAKRNAQSAGVAGFVHLERRDAVHVEPPPETPLGLVITNPPYGERLGDRAELPALYRDFGQALKDRFAGWRAAVLAGDEELGRALRLSPDKRYTLFNGALETPLLTFAMRPRDAAPREQKPLSEGAQMLKNRMEKNVRHLRKRLTREGITCFRAYDQDLPEYAAAIDVYENWLHIQEYKAPQDVPVETARIRLREITRVASEIFDIPRDRIAVKTRERGKGGSKYGQFDQKGEFIEVQEGGLRFLINPTDYLDTGLFLDHRIVREKIRELSPGKHVLNLFAYTGTASVYAAAGDARDTTTVDLSGTYLDWASRNLALNGYSGARHRLVQEDSITFLETRSMQYGLIYVDPPTFSNSKKADDFDVQRDHVKLLMLCLERLLPDGVIVFSNNFRRFQLDKEALAPHFHIEDWSAPSIPFDFSRRHDIHSCWILRKPYVNPWTT